MENSIINLLEIQKENNEISRETHNIVFLVGSEPVISYGLAKIRKPFRPIMSANGILTYKLGRFFVPLLEPLTNNQYTIKGSSSFSGEIKIFDSSLIMVNFDGE